MIVLGERPPYRAPSCSAFGNAPFPRARGLGAGLPGVQQASGIVGGAAATAGTVLSSSAFSTSALAAAAVPVVGWIVAGAALAALLASYLGGGCGEACVIPAKAEQIYEVAADDIYDVGAAGELGASDTVAGVTAMLNAGIQHVQQLGTGKHIEDAITNMRNKSIGPIIAAASKLPAQATRTLDASTVQSLFKMRGPGWSSGSVVSGDQLAVAYLQSVAQAGASSALARATVSRSGIQIAGTDVSWPEILIGAGLLAGAVYLL